MILQDLMHIVILVLELHLGRVRAIAAVNLCSRFLHHRFPLLEPLHAVVTDDIDHVGFLHSPVHLLEVEKALVPLCMPRYFQGRKQRVVFPGHQDGVFHFIFRSAGMDAEAVNGNRGLGRVECLVLIVRDIPAVHRIGKISAKAFDIKAAGPHADLLIRSKSDADLPVGHALSQQLLHCLEDHGDARLVIRPQKGGPV